MNSLRRKMTPIGCSSFDLQSLENRRMLSAAPAVLPTVTLVQTRSLSATFEFTDPAGIDVTILVTASDTVTQQLGKKPQAVKGIDIELEAFDQVNFVDDILAEGSINNVKLQIGPNLKSGSVQATVPVTDEVTTSAFTLAVNLKFNSPGPLITTHGSNYDPGSSTFMLMTDATRDMTANGSVDFLSYAPGATPLNYFPPRGNFAPQPSIAASSDDNTVITAVFPSNTSASQGSTSLVLEHADRGFAGKTIARWPVKNDNRSSVGKPWS